MKIYAVLKNQYFLTICSTDFKKWCYLNILNRNHGVVDDDGHAIIEKALSKHHEVQTVVHLWDTTKTDAFVS